MVGFLKRLLTPQGIEETARSAVKGLDSIVYTEQEKAEKTQMAQDLYSKLWMAATPSAISRRLIAIAFVFTYCLMAIISTLLYIFGQKDSAEFSLGVLKDLLLQPVNIIVGFYFLKQIVTEYRKKGDSE